MNATISPLGNKFLLPDFNNPVVLHKKLQTQTEDYWIKRGEANALKLFHLMAKRIPAYKDFLKKNKLNPEKVKTIQDFKQIPTIDKQTYLKQYPLESLCWDGKLKEKQYVYATTSGSTGEPFYFPRQKEQDTQYAITAELYLRSNFEIHKKSTLYICGFAMGAWIGGLFTYQAIQQVAQRGKYKLSIITPGSSKEEVVKAVKNIGKCYDQIIIGGYPPFIKDTIDFGIANGLSWKDYNLGFIFSADGFSELFRDYIANKTGLKDIYKNTLNHYGTVDLGTMSHETPLSILIRRLGKENKDLNKSIFTHDHKQPTCTQYIPEMFFFEEMKGQLFCSAFSGIPLVRYDLKDIGEVATFSDIKRKFMDNGIDLLKEAKKVNISETVWNLPFVNIYERTDFVVKLYGANIYPETIKKALCDMSLSDYITSKFTIIVQFDKQQNQFLEIHIELKNGVEESKEIKNKILEIILQFLLKENSEFRYLYGQISHRQITPKIILWDNSNPIHFRQGGKQKWVKL